MYEFARYQFVERQQKQKFDSISDGHVAAMVSMGLMQAPEQRQETGPDCPVLFLDTFDKYRELKFMQRDDEDRITLIPRNAISWQDIQNYKNVTGQTVSFLESELIMGLDAIFEGRDND